MNEGKQFKLRADELQRLVSPMGACFCTDHITVQGLPIAYMYREAPDNNIDSGWSFFSGTESQAYLDDDANTSLYEVNAIANYDPAIIPYLDSDVGTRLERIPGTKQFRKVQ